MTTRPHWSFWLISGLMLLWNVAGSANFIVQMNPDMIASYREHEQTLISNRPLWATAGFAFAVFGGAIGCILLLLRKRIAMTFFILSLIGVVITIIHSLLSGVQFGMTEIMGIIMLPLEVAVFAIWYTWFTRRKGWVG